MRPWLTAVLKLLWAAYLLATSLYCLLAYLPYTYYAFIKAPVYEWMPWFAAHHILLYWPALAAGAVGYFSKRQRALFVVAFGFATACGIALIFHPVLPAIQSDGTALALAMAALLLLILSALPVTIETWPTGALSEQPLVGYSAPAVAAVLLCLLGLLGTDLRFHTQHSAGVQSGSLFLWIFSLITHIVLAIVVVTALNMLSLIVVRSRFAREMRAALLLLIAFIILWRAIARFLETAVSASNPAAELYAAELALALCCVGASLVRPVTLRLGTTVAKNRTRSWVLVAVAGISCIAALFVPSEVGAWDWNGFFQSIFALALWAVIGYTICALFPQRRRYSWQALAAVLVITVFFFKAFEATDFLWARSLGTTQDGVAQSVQAYAEKDFSFGLASEFLGQGLKRQTCDDLCRILREYTNIREATARKQLQLVENLAPTTGERPNIFIFVIDSMRPDYLGAYNSKVDFTPNIDAFARDSVVFRNAYTQYAGTTLSEPAIWSGALLLHTHYIQPFAKVNSLERLVKTDGYEQVISYDTVLQQLIQPSADLVKLDTDKALWNEFEVGSTVKELEQALDAKPDRNQPVFFYAQPMNVHVFAHNSLPTARDEKWQRAGFNSRISFEVHQVDQALGEFFAFLKARGLYDKSIIILASDHGDATGELGRNLHSAIIYPEVMRVPLIIHLPKSMAGKFVHHGDDLATLTDITPSLYYLLGHGPVEHNPLFGRPLFTKTGEELASYARKDLFLASDARATYGILSDHGRFLYTVYDEPAQSMFFDLSKDPRAQHNIVTPALKSSYDRRVIDDLKMIADFYGYKPPINSFLAADNHFH